MKKSELRKIIKEELIKEDSSKWEVPFEVKWKKESDGIYRVVIFSENGKHLLADTRLSDSMPNDIKIFNNALLKVSKLANKLADKN